MKKVLFAVSLLLSPMVALAAAAQPPAMVDPSAIAQPSKASKPTQPTVAMDFDPSQLHLLAVARAEGILIGYPETIQAILLQETLAGKLGKTDYGYVGDLNKAIGKKSYGVMQVQLGTAKDALKHMGILHKFRSDEEIIVALMTDPTFCIEIATWHFKWLLDRGLSWKDAVRAYNAGPGDLPAGDPYLKAIWTRIQTIRKLRGGEES